MTYISEHANATSWREAATENNLTERYGTDDLDFAVWLYLLDRRLSRAVGLTHTCGEDRDWWSAFDSGMSPGECATETIAEWMGTH